MERRKMTITVCIDYSYDPSKTDERAAEYSAVDLVVNPNFSTVLCGTVVNSIEIDR